MSLIETRVAGQAEIVLSDGTIWIATPSSATTYDFVSTNEHGVQAKARWIKRNGKRAGVDGLSEPKFIFSIMDPNSRRHPILATITQDKLDIPDTYTPLSSTAEECPPASPLMSDTSSSREDTSTGRPTLAIDESTKLLIQITGIWLALREGWSPYFKYNDMQGNSASRIPSSSSTQDLSRSGNTGVLEASSSPLCTLSNRMLRVSSDRTPKRSISTGTAFMQRENARRFGNAPSIVASDSDGDAEKSVILTNKSDDNYPAIDSPPGSGTATPETPTRRSRRHQSVQLPTSGLQKEVVDRAHRHSMLDMRTRDSVPKQKAGPWKSFANIFRKTKKTG